MRESLAVSTIADVPVVGPAAASRVIGSSASTTPA
jgi:hypothetical protein